ncbi:MAG TPA: hypothetical protein VF607_16615, partial [Verrucomicrobiae bacterium]
MMKKQLNLMAGAALLSLATTSVIAADQQSATWLDETISPVANPIFFEDAKINSEIHPLYMYHWLPQTFDYAGGTVKLGGGVQVLAVQARYALNDKLALIATKDGYVQFQPDSTLEPAYGFADLAAGLKYNIYRDDEKQILVTPGLTITIPTGNRSVVQGHGAGVEDLFVSAEKGFGQVHL